KLLVCGLLKQALRKLTVCITYSVQDLFEGASSNARISRISLESLRSDWRSSAVRAAEAECGAAVMSSDETSALFVSEASASSSDETILSFPPARRSFANRFLAPAIVY